MKKRMKSQQSLSSATGNGKHENQSRNDVILSVCANENLKTKINKNQQSFNPDFSLIINQPHNLPSNAHANFPLFIRWQYYPEENQGTFMTKNNILGHRSDDLGCSDISTNDHDRLKSGTTAKLKCHATHLWLLCKQMASPDTENDHGLTCVGYSESQESETGVNGEAEVEPPPDGGYGWVCVAACFTINCFTWGVVAVSC